MKRFLSTLFFVLTITISFAQSLDRIHIFGIGNSFMEDILTRVPELTSSFQNEIDLNFLLYWGAGLDEHLGLIRSNKPQYILYHYDTDSLQWTKRNVSFSEIIDQQKWDIILLQQSSQYSGNFDKTKSPLKRLLQTLQSHHPQAEYYWHLSWAYASNSTHPSFSMYDHSQDRMYYSIVKTGSKIIRESFNDDFDGYIPTGPVIQKLRQSYLNDENDFCRDGYHIDMNLGRYATACTFYESVLARHFNKSILDINEIPQNDSIHTSEDFLFIRQTINDIVHNDSLVWGGIETDRIYKTIYYDALGRPINDPTRTGFLLARYYYVSGKTSSEKYFKTH